MAGQQKPPRAEVIVERDDIVRHVFDRKRAAKISSPGRSAIVNRNDCVFSHQLPHHQTPNGVRRSETRYQDQHLPPSAVAPVMQWSHGRAHWRSSVFILLARGPVLLESLGVQGLLCEHDLSWDLKSSQPLSAERVQPLPEGAVPFHLPQPEGSCYQLSGDRVPFVADRNVNDIGQLLQYILDLGRINLLPVVVVVPVFFSFLLLLL